MYDNVTLTLDFSSHRFFLTHSPFLHVNCLSLHLKSEKLVESVIFIEKQSGLIFLTSFKKFTTSCHDWFCGYFATLYHSTKITFIWTIYLSSLQRTAPQFKMIVKVVEIPFWTFLCSVAHDSLANNQRCEKEVMSLYLVQQSKVLRSSSQSLQWRYRLLHSSRHQENLLPQWLSTKYEKDQKVSHRILYHKPYKLSMTLSLKTCSHTRPKNDTLIKTEIVHQPEFPQRLAKPPEPTTILYRGIQPVAIIIRTFLV